MFKIGDKLFIRTVTYHWTGEVVKIEDGIMQLADASWIALGERHHEVVEDGKVDESEFVGEAYIAVGAIVDAFPWKHDLPVETR